MANRIEWFLVEVERRIEGKLSPRRIQSVSDEVRDHLEASRDEFVQMGLDPQVAEAKAVATFGRPEVLSEQILEPTIRHTFGINTELLLKVAALAMCAIFPYLFFRDNGPFSIGYSTYAAGLFLLAVTFLFTRVNRIQSATIAGFSFLIVAVMGFGFGQFTIYEQNTGLHYVSKLPRDIESYGRMAAGYGELEQLYSRGIGAFSTKGAVTDSGFVDPAKGYRVPPAYVSYYHGEVASSFDWEKDLSKAKYLWSVRGQEYLSSVRDAKLGYSRAVEGLTPLLNIKPRGADIFLDYWPNMLVAFAALSISLISLNGVAMGFGRMLRRRPARRVVA